MARYTKYNIYDVVMPKRPTSEAGGVILDYEFRRYGDQVEVVYELFSGGRRQWIREAEVKRIGRFPTPLRYNQRVIVEGRALGRRRGVPGTVTGIAWDPERNEWGYTVRLNSGRTVGVMGREVRPPRHRLDYGEKVYSRLAAEAKHASARTLLRRSDVLLPGMRAPRSGIYAQVTPTGRVTRARTAWQQGVPLPTTQKAGRGWALIDPNGQSVRSSSPVA